LRRRGGERWGGVGKQKGCRRGKKEKQAGLALGAVKEMRRGGHSEREDAGAAYIRKEGGGVGWKGECGRGVGSEV